MSTTGSDLPYRGYGETASLARRRATPSARRARSGTTARHARRASRMPRGGSAMARDLKACGGVPGYRALRLPSRRELRRLARAQDEQPGDAGDHAVEVTVGLVEEVPVRALLVAVLEGRAEDLSRDRDEERQRVALARAARPVVGVLRAPALLDLPAPRVLGPVQPRRLGHRDALARLLARHAAKELGGDLVGRQRRGALAV